MNLRFHRTLAFLHRGGRRLGAFGCAIGLAGSLLLSQASVAHGAEHRVFEMRTYTTHPGRLDALHKRFGGHTNRIFVKHGMSLIGYWTPAEGPESKNTLVYILAYPSRTARDAAWQEFRDDPEWKRAKEASERDGKIVDKVVSVFLNATDYSPIQ